ncbi:MAG: hypothetical protein CMM28_12065 [Rhodospirillaceae bacterium]|nr:hypothetical protein [Rhodospirillaceae bacterium]|tara:strand:- start:31 stop:303 length:273 start_codon:yes stop_codon:yes gene_type:complete
MMLFMDDNFIQEIQKAFGATENMLKNHSGGLVALAAIVVALARKQNVDGAEVDALITRLGTPQPGEEDTREQARRFARELLALAAQSSNS